jgi:hypothetical protein
MVLVVQRRFLCLADGGGLDVVCQEIKKMPYLRTTDRFTIRIRRKNTASRIFDRTGLKPS